MNIHLLGLGASLVLITGLLPHERAHAGPDPFLGEIMWTAATFCPRGWADADGQLLPVAQNQALFSLFGTTYGGDGRTTFALPDLRGRVALNVGQGPGLTSYSAGGQGGEEQVTLDASQMPVHNHLLQAGAGNTTNDPDGARPGTARQKIYDVPGQTTVAMDPAAVSVTGGGQAHENRPPYLVVRACVAVQGVFPSRN